MKKLTTCNINRLKAFQKNLLTCLGGEWPEPCNLEPLVEDTIIRDGYHIERITYQVEPQDRVAAYLLIPDKVTPKNPAPAIAVWHQHKNQFAIGKSEPAGLTGDKMHFTGVELARLGYVVLCPDALCFEERQDPMIGGQNFEQFISLQYIINGKSLAWKNILDMRRAIDYLCTRFEVNIDSIGCYGHSLGSIFTWLIGPWEPRLKCLVGNCALPTYTAIKRTRLVSGGSIYIPGLAQYGDTPDIAALIAPRPFHLNFGALDRHSPIKEVREAVKMISEIYKEYKAEDKFTYFIEEDQGHVLSEQMWKKVRSTILKYLPLK